jgi:uncharacterized protein YraI
LATPARAQTAGYIYGHGNLRAGPSREFPLVAVLPAGTQVQIYGCTDDWLWCDIDAGPSRGWLYARHLESSSGGRRVVIFGHGPTLGLPIVTFSLGTYWDTYYRGRPWYGRRSYWIGRPLPPHRPRPPHYRPPTRPPHGGRPPARPPRPPVRPQPRPPRPQPRPTPNRPNQGAVPRRTPPSYEG